MVEVEAYFRESFVTLERLADAYLGLGMGREGLGLLICLPVVPLLFFVIGLGTHMKRPIAAFMLAFMGEALLGAPLLGGTQDPRDVFWLSIARLLAWLLPALLGWFLPRIMAPVGVGYMLCLVLYFAVGDVRLGLILGGILALSTFLFWRWCFPHVTALGGAALLAYLVFLSDTPLTLPLPLSASARLPITIVVAIVLSGVGISMQLSRERNRDKV